MNRRWLLFDLINPAFGLSRSERKKILTSAKASKGTKKQFFLWIYASFLLALLVSLLPIAVLVWLDFSGAPFIFVFLVSLLIPIIFYLFILYGFHRALAKPLRNAMQRHGYESCHQCQQPLIGLDKDIELCPECGASREPLTCQSCGYDLTGLEGSPPSCPECGDTQKTFRNPSRWWWLRFQQVDHRFLYFPDSTRKRIIQEAWKVSLGRFLITVPLISVLLISLILFTIIFDQEEYNLPLMLDMFMGILLNASIGTLYCLMAASFHKTFGASCRRQYRELGYDLCHKCGRLLYDLDDGAKTCLDCNAPRQVVPVVAAFGTGLPTLEEVKAIDESLQAKMWIHAANRKRIYIPAVLFLATLYGGPYLVLTYTNNLIGWSAYAIALVVMLYTIIKYSRKSIRRTVHKDLHEKGHDLCTACGFWFTQLDDAPNQCPDCSAKREAPSRIYP